MDSPVQGAVIPVTIPAQLDDGRATMCLTDSVFIHIAGSVQVRIAGPIQRPDAG